MNDKKLNKFATRPLFVWIAIIAAIVLLMNFNGNASSKIQQIDVRQLQNLASSGSLVEISVKNVPESGKDWYVIDGKMRNPLAGSEGAPAETPKTLDFRFDGRITDDIYKQLVDPKSTWKIKEIPSGSIFGNILMNVVPMLLIFGLLYFLFVRQMRSAGRGAMDFGKSRARLLSPQGDKVTFKDVAGCEESKEEVAEIVEFLKNPKRFQDIGARIPKGVLMVGPPGTGKTLLARAVAGEADVPFFSISGSDFVEMFVGVGSARVRDMFDQARKSAPCLVFIDEIDAVGRQRGAGMGNGNDEREQTLNSLLVEMDGFDNKTGVIVIAATNRPDVLDSALLRAGRFDRQVVIDLPDVKGREEILKVHAKKVKLDESVDLSRVARMTAGCSGADLANLLNEGAIIAARRKESKVSAKDLDEARDKAFFGRERKKIMDAKERRLTAYHEAGHALVQAVIDDGKLPIHKVTIIPRGQSLGSTMFIPSKDILMESKKSLLDNICTSLGGRAAEEVEFGEITNGAAGDIQQATKIARKMVCDWGMSSLGPVAYGGNQEHIFLGREIARDKRFSDETARLIDREISFIVEGELERARKIVSENKDKLDAIVEELLKNETIDGSVVYKIVLGREIEEGANSFASSKTAEASKGENPQEGVDPFPAETSGEE